MDRLELNKKSLPKKMGAALGLSLAQMAGLAPDQIIAETLKAIADDLRAGAPE